MRAHAPPSLLRYGHGLTALAKRRCPAHRGVTAVSVESGGYASRDPAAHRRLWNRGQTQIRRRSATYRPGNFRLCRAEGRVWDVGTGGRSHHRAQHGHRYPPLRNSPGASSPGHRVRVRASPARVHGARTSHGTGLDNPTIRSIPTGSAHVVAILACRHGRSSD